MKLQKKPYQWSCLATSFAMVLDMPVEEVFAMVGHDGGRVLFPDLPEPNCRRGHHVQELIDVCWEKRYAVTPIELFPQIAATPRQEGLVLPDHRTEVVYFRGSRETSWFRFESAIRFGKGVITGMGRRCGHAVAYDHGMIFDPDGDEYPYLRDECLNRKFFVQCAWQINQLPHP